MIYINLIFSHIDLPILVVDKLEEFLNYSNEKKLNLSYFGMCQRGQILYKIIYYVIKKEYCYISLVHKRIILSS